MGTQVSVFPGQCEFCCILWPVGLYPDETVERSNNTSELPEVTLGLAELGWGKTHRSLQAQWVPGVPGGPPCRKCKQNQSSVLSLGSIPPVPN